MRVKEVCLRPDLFLSNILSDIMCIVPEVSMTGPKPQKKPCTTNIALFDIRLTEKTDPRDDEVLTVVQPDLSVFCNKTDHKKE